MNEIENLIKRIEDCMADHYDLKLDGTPKFADHSFMPESWEWIEYYQELIADIIDELSATRNHAKNQI